ncbi:MAG TPA: PLP-dependent aminotransferase family protein [Anaerolineae bacterium]|nr:PLP-dependent aminotransferase family protein [Anaerolineae bacterium]HMR64808.1 PLP-dependent aminotransferase family protein [Anaerolineae bacterium]
MSALFAGRMQNTQKSFIREILKVTEDPEVISFAGGLPNPNFFPVEALAEVSAKVLAQDGRRVLQYSTTAGYQPLRELIAQRYANQGLVIDPDEILIINGSQQGLDLVGKLFLEAGDRVILERPGYLGAIQAFSLYEPEFVPVSLEVDGPHLAELEAALSQSRLKLFYTVPNFQNPSGLTYTEAKRRAVAELVRQRDLIVVEDNPYGELRFTGEDAPSLKSFLGEQTVLLGSFSKVVAPGLRLGWICASPAIMDKLIVAKQAVDLHSNYFSQRVVAQFLLDHDLEAHLEQIRALYRRQCELMVSLMDELFPPEVTFTRPEGGMFIWVTLPEGISSMDLFERAAQRKVVFVPGSPFYVDGGGHNTLRLNFSNADEARIETGMIRLVEAMKEVLAQPRPVV